MKNKLIIRSVLSLSFVVIVMAVAIVAFSSSSYAWFAKNDDVDGNQMGVSMVDSHVLYIEEYRVYKRNIENQEIVEVSNNISGDPLYLKKVSFNEYDTIIKERNEGTHIVISVVIGYIKSGSSIKVSITNSNPIEVSEQSDPLDSYLSNICSFRCKYGNRRDSISDAFSSFGSESYEQFVTVTNTENNGIVTWVNNKTDSIEMIISNYDGAIYEEDGESKLRVYIEISYNENLVSNYLTQNNESTDFSDITNSTVSFANDMEPFKFDYINN